MVSLIHQNTLGKIGKFLSRYVTNKSKKIQKRYITTRCPVKSDPTSGSCRDNGGIMRTTRLRQKIEANPKNPKYLQTIRGSGYVLWIE